MKDHYPEYLAEFFGTAIMMIIGVGAIALMWSQGSVMRTLIPSDDLRRLLTGMMFAGGATAVVLSPLGQRSGGHLNPAVTLAFWWKGQVPLPDLFWYSVAQIAGAFVGVALVELIGGDAARSIQLGVTLPGPQGPWVAFGAEIFITFLLVLLILYSVNNARLAPHTPYLVGTLVALLVFLEAPVSGTSLNPARSFAPAVLAGVYDSQWLYWLGPILGGLIAVSLFARVFAEKKAGCAKLYHTDRYRCIFSGCSMRRYKAGETVMIEGEAADTAYVVEKGELEIRKHSADGRDLVLATLREGDWVGEMALLLRLPRSATVVAVTAAELRIVTQENFAHVIADHPEETQKLLHQLSERLHHANMRLGGDAEGLELSVA